MIKNHFHHISVTLAIFMIFSSSCLPVKTMHNSEKAGAQNIIVPVAEMTSTAEIESYQFTKEANPPDKALFLKKLSEFSGAIQQVNLVNISGWAKAEMQGFKLAGNFIDNSQVEQYYQTKEITVLKLKVADLPSHAAIVKRFLYLIPVYDSSTIELKKIFITIEGHAEE